MSTEQYEQSSDNPSISPVNATTNSDINSTMKEQLNNKILAVHDKITNIVFHQIDKQLELVNISMNRLVLYFVVLLIWLIWIPHHDF
jgi:hypothetical protein